MTKKPAVIVGGAALLAAMVLAVELRAQTSALPMRPYRKLAGCSEKPAEFQKCAIEKAKTFNPPRLPDGTPDFRGSWARSRVSTDNIEEHPQTFENPGGVSMVVDPADGKIPYQPWAAALRLTHPPAYRDTQSSCFVPGPPRQAYAPGGYAILQIPGAVTFLSEFAHTFRVIPTDGRPHVGPSIRLGLGDSRGRWEGNTLVVDVTNLRAQAWFDHMGNFYSQDMHLVERWTMIAPDAIHYEGTLTDPKVYTRPWTMAFGVRRNAEPAEQWEVACHEGSRTEFTEMGLKPFPYNGAKVP